MVPGEISQAEPAAPRGWAAAAPKLVVSVLICGGFVWLLQRGGLAVIPNEAAFAGMTWWAIPLAIGMNVLSSYFRTCRWVYLLRPIAPGLSKARVLGIGLVGFTAVVFAPMRMGEFVRPYLLARDREVTFSQGLGATAAERIIDGLVISLALFVALLTVPHLSPLPDHLGALKVNIALVPRAAYVAVALFAGAFLAMVVFHWKRDAAVRIVGSALGAVSERLAAFVTQKVERLADGLRFLPSRRHFVPFLLNTVAYYAVLALGHWGLLVGCGIRATLGQTWIVLGVMSLGILVPAGPGFFGAYQLSIYSSLAMFFPESTTLSAGAAFVFVSYTVQLAVTLLSAVAGVLLMLAFPAGSSARAAAGAGDTADDSVRKESEPFPWGNLATTVVVLLAANVSAVLLAAQVVLGKNRFLFLSANNVPTETRNGLIAAVFTTVGVTLSWVLFQLVRRKRDALPGLERVSRILSPLAVLWAIPALTTQAFGSAGPITYLLMLAGVVVALDRLLKISLESMPEAWWLWAGNLSRRISSRVKRWTFGGLVALCACGYAAYMGYYSILQHYRFQTSGYDLGIYTSLVANLLAGNSYRSTVLSPDVSYLSHHAELGTIYLAPIYALLPRAETLLVLQSVALGGAAIPLYLFASTQLPRASAALLAIAYLFYAPLHGPNFYDFHWMPMTLPLWFTLFYGVAKRRLSIIVPVVLLILPMREETGLMLAALGFYLVVGSYWPKLGFAFGAVGLSWFVAMRGFLVPSFGDAQFEGIYKGLVAPGEAGFSSVINTLIVNPNFLWKTLATPAKLKYLLHLFAPLALVPLRRLPLLGLLVPGSLFTLLTTDYEPTVSIAFQYTTHWIPWLFLVSVIVLRGLARGDQPAFTRRAAVTALALGVFCHSVVFGAFFQSEAFRGGFRGVSFEISQRELRRHATLMRLAAEVPLDARIATTDPQSPHLGHWSEVCTLRITYCNAEYLLISGREFSSEDRRNVNRAMEAASYGLLDSADDFYLFKKDHVSTATDSALSTLRLTPPRPAGS